MLLGKSCYYNSFAGISTAHTNAEIVKGLHINCVSLIIHVQLVAKYYQFVFQTPLQDFVQGMLQCAH